MSEIEKILNKTVTNKKVDTSVWREGLHKLKLQCGIIPQFTSPRIAKRLWDIRSAYMKINGQHLAPMNCGYVRDWCAAYSSLTYPFKYMNLTMEKLNEIS